MKQKDTGNVTALGLTNNVSTKLTYKYGVEGVVSQHNGSSYSTFSKPLTLMLFQNLQLPQPQQ